MVGELLLGPDGVDISGARILQHRTDARIPRQFEVTAIMEMFIPERSRMELQTSTIGFADRLKKGYC